MLYERYTSLPLNCIFMLICYCYTFFHDFLICTISFAKELESANETQLLFVLSHFFFNHRDIIATLIAIGTKSFPSYWLERLMKWASFQILCTKSSLRYLTNLFKDLLWYPKCQFTRSHWSFMLESNIFCCRLNKLSMINFWSHVRYWLFLLICSLWPFM